MILLIGSSGYIGSAFSSELTRRGIPWTSASHGEWMNSISRTKDIDLVINCAGFIPETSVSVCEQNKAETIRANLLLPAKIAAACDVRGIVFAHLSTGYLWNDDLEHSEHEPTTRAFSGYLGFYIGIKMLAEEEISKFRNYFIWRLSLAFDEYDHPRNYLSKLASFPKVFDRINLVTHRADFAKACLDLWQKSCPFGIYHVMNSGAVSAKKIVDLLIEAGIRKTMPEIVAEQHGSSRASIDKLIAAGITMRSSEDAIKHSISNWKSQHHV